MGALKCTMVLRRSVTNAGFKVLSRSHRTLLGLSRGRMLRTAFGMPVVELRTVGRTSGQVRSTMLTTPVHDAGRVVLVASKGGDDHDPHWYKNLQANPDVEIIMAGQHRRMRARTATPAERAELWPQIVGAYNGYGAYQSRSARQIPVIICEPVSESSSVRR
jgi:deazaflavin-dependent oxidoreductase (nitroreductase family)